MSYRIEIHTEHLVVAEVCVIKDWNTHSTSRGRRKELHSSHFWPLVPVLQSISSCVVVFHEEICQIWSVCV